MMTAKQIPSLGYISEFNASKQARLFEALEQLPFSGELVLTDPKGQKWIFYLHLGRIIYATGGTHPVRRWQRNLAAHCPQIPAKKPADVLALQRELAGTAADEGTSCWEYQLLCLWVEQQKITREQAEKMIRSASVEVFFDVMQAMSITYQINQSSSLSTQLVLIDANQVIAEAHQLWQTWQAAKLAERSPNWAPVIRQPEQLTERTSANVYQTRARLLDGQHTLRDLAARMKRDVAEVACLLLPSIQLGLVELVEIPDLPSLIAPPTTKKILPTAAAPQGPLIACVDDSPVVCQTMEKVLKAAGYRFVGMNDALRAIAMLLARKPKLIFLDLVMPNTNGYEICSQLRKLSVFRNTPIVILTGNDSIIDRVRAKLVGASDFLGKPVDDETLLTVIRKHLKQSTPT